MHGCFSFDSKTQQKMFVCMPASVKELHVYAIIFLQATYDLLTLYITLYSEPIIRTSLVTAKGSGVKGSGVR